MKKTEYTKTEVNSIKAKALDKLAAELATGCALMKGETDEEKKRGLALCFVKSGLYGLMDVLRVNDVATVQDFHDVNEVLRIC